MTRLSKQWTDDHTVFQARDLSDSDDVYVWADGVHPRVLLGRAHSCVLVLMGVRPDGRKELIALAEGLRESTVIAYGRGGEIASNRRDEQEMFVLCLRIL
ncbi:MULTISPECIES: hypothetical protein [unclassified Streptomyces]|uniref:hypothetical protein n=1 Tax=unclassified Streptomyces TaxID=2593676 RepID=UPI0036E8A2A6